MWPSEDWASKLYDLANWFLIGALIVGAVSTVLLVWMGNIKEAYLRVALAGATEKAASAIERAETANKAAEDERLARLKLEAVIQPRDMSADEQKELKSAMRKFAGRLVSVRSYALDTEGSRLATIILSALHASGIQISDQRGNLFNLSAGWNVVEGVQIAGPHSQDDLINALLKSPLGMDPHLKMFRKEDPRILESAPVEIMVGVKPVEAIP
jgi:hypothetical protein